MTDVDSTDPRALITLIAQQDKAIDFAQFSYADAFDLGSALVRQGREADLGIAICVMFGQQRVFHAALQGSSADNDVWLDRKVRVVARYNMPSMLLKARLDLSGVDIAAMPQLDHTLLPAPGGGFPLRVRGSLIGVVAVSGLTDRQDHDMVVAAMEEAADRSPVARGQGENA